jgi:hypothetical protein
VPDVSMTRTSSSPASSHGGKVSLRNQMGLTHGNPTSLPRSVITVTRFRRARILVLFSWLWRQVTALASRL